MNGAKMSAHRCLRNVHTSLKNRRKNADRRRIVLYVIKGPSAQKRLSQMWFGLVSLKEIYNVSRARAFKHHRQEEFVRFKTPTKVFFLGDVRRLRASWKT
ncbi:hypothetical protein Zmor_005548 [Zophobas morio]|uniref:Uncharacterized protein n=1 Tax=Zophobas morio TaxID=2755281 RepID=A0AA38IS83_9CUCU|nr:hypothetical protein Zmor_005548 [Zophobas morio]